MTEQETLVLLELVLEGKYEHALAVLVFYLLIRQFSKPEKTS